MVPGEVVISLSLQICRQWDTPSGRTLWRVHLPMGISFRLQYCVVPSDRRPLWIFPDSQ